MINDHGTVCKLLAKSNRAFYPGFNGLNNWWWFSRGVVARPAGKTKRGFKILQSNEFNRFFYDKAFLTWFLLLSEILLSRVLNPSPKSRKSCKDFGILRLNDVVICMILDSILKGFISCSAVTNVKPPDIHPWRSRLSFSYVGCSWAIRYEQQREQRTHVANALHLLLCIIVLTGS